MTVMDSSDFSYYIDFQYDAGRLLSWYRDNTELQEPWPGRGYNILKYLKIFNAGKSTNSNYPLDLRDKFCQSYDFDPELVSCQFVQIPAGHEMPLHTDTHTRKFAVLFPLIGGTPTVFCNKVGRCIAEVEHRKNVPVLVRADIPHKTTSLPECDKINYQLSFKTEGGKHPLYVRYWDIRDKLKAVDENKLC